MRLKTRRADVSSPFKFQLPLRPIVSNAIEIPSYTAAPREKIQSCFHSKPRNGNGLKEEIKEMSWPASGKNENGQRPDVQGWQTFIIMLCGVSLCLVVSIFIILFYVYMRFYSNSSRHQRTIGSRSAGNEQDYVFTAASEGLCKHKLDALPVFVYSPDNFKDGLRCAVCLCEFQGEETGRLLPVCDHRFHSDCIDMWFSSHSTCPICRASVENVSDENLQPPVFTAEVGIPVTEAEEED